MTTFNNNLSLVIYGKRDIRLEHTSIPEKLGPNECLLQTHSCGICGSDMHLFEDGRILDFVVKEPVVIGHEISAQVIKVGVNVTKLKPGDRVAVEPAIVCLKCDVCRQGRYNLCQLSLGGIKGVPPHNGGQTKYFSHFADFCHKIPDNMSYEEGALIEPMAVAVHAMKRVSLAVGDNVLVCGAGTIGLLCMLCAKAFGANKVFITDINETRLELARKLGADLAYLIEPKNFNEYDFAQKIQKDMQHPIDILIECSGSQSSVSLAMYATKIGGKVCIVGVGSSRMDVPLIYAALREINIIGCYLYRDTFPLAIHLVSSGKVDVKPLITHKFKVEDYMKAFSLMESGASSSVKIMIQH